MPTNQTATNASKLVISLEDEVCCLHNLLKIAPFIPFLDKKCEGIALSL